MPIGDFDKYINGGYIESFFSYWPINKSKDNVSKALKFLKKKVNNRGAYKPKNLLHLFESCREITEKIKNECTEF